MSSSNSYGYVNGAGSSIGAAPGCSSSAGPFAETPPQTLESGIIRNIESELEDTNSALVEIEILLERLRRKVYGVTPSAVAEAGGATANAKPAASLQTISDKAQQVGYRSRDLRTQLQNILADL